MQTIKEIMSKYPNYRNTCPVYNLQDGCITFIRNKKYLKLETPKDVVVLVQKGLADLPDGWCYEFVDNVDYVFTMIHNTLYKDLVVPKNVIGMNCFIHPTAVLDVEGMHVTKAPDGRRIQLKHIGNVVLEDDVMVLALATLQKAVFGSTIIKRGSKIDSHVNIGHNSFIDENSVIALGAILGGSVRLGKNCMVGLGAVIRNGINICDNVIIGMGSNVVSDIVSPGIYMGSPAKFLKSYDKDWNF